MNSNLHEKLEKSYLFKFAFPASTISTVVCFGPFLFHKNLFKNDVRIIYLINSIEKAIFFKKKFSEKKIPYKYEIIVCRFPYEPFTKIKAQIAFIITDDAQYNISSCINLAFKKECYDIDYLFITYLLPKNICKKILSNFNFKFSSRFSTIREVMTIFHYPSLEHISFAYIFRSARFSFDRFFFELKQLFMGNNKTIIYSQSTKKIPHLIKAIHLKTTKQKNTRNLASHLIRAGTGDAAVCDLGPYIVRLPQSPRGKKRCQNNYRSLRFLQQIGLKHVPHPKQPSALAGQEYYIETKLGGVSLDLIEVSPSFRQQVQNQAIEIISSPTFRLGTITNSLFHEIIDSEAIELKSSSCLSLDYLLLVTQLMKECFLKEKMPLVILHGDFKMSNLLVKSKNNPTITGIIDWDLAQIPGFPLYDLFTLLYSNEKTDAWEFPKKIWAYVNESQPNPFIDTYTLNLGLSRKMIVLLALITTIRFLNRVFLPEIKQSQKWREKLIEECLLPFSTYCIKTWTPHLHV